MDLEIPERFNAAVYFVDRNLQAGRGDKIAIRHEGRSYTYRDIAGLVNRWGNVLRELGVEAERRIALLCLDSPEFVAGFFGASSIERLAVEPAIEEQAKRFKALSLKK